MSTFWDDPPPPVVKIHNFFFFRMNPSLIKKCLSNINRKSSYASEIRPLDSITIDNLH